MVNVNHIAFIIREVIVMPKESISKLHERIFSTGEVAKRLNLRRCQLNYLIESGVIPEPKCRAGGKRLFSAAEAEQAAECLRHPSVSREQNDIECDSEGVEL